ncbi:putative lytic enzyme [Flavobacterium phage FLiP]|uniref:Putative lytic enzyme n=1 Tax=Flavobacterium phage FLiP TaxID=2023716 RepID=A0A222NP76_9VIRU|nr:putative lytic enzyme [Flavobacterium phage FLiP]ASQ41215.1 putative lytic enzyme [Flavobacterium phage FLiP]
MEQFKDIINGTKPVSYAGVRYNGAGVSYEAFDKKMQEVADRLGWFKEWLYAVMYVETAGTYSPAIKNTKSSATGLIQFMEATAKNLGTTTANLKLMNGVQQLEYVYKYFKPYKDKVFNGYDVYLAVFRPAWLNDKTDVITTKSTAYIPNRGIDIDNDGKITYENFVDWVNMKNPILLPFFKKELTPDLVAKNKSWFALVALAIAGGFYVVNQKEIHRQLKI